MHENWIHHIKRVINSSELPGVAAQCQMAPFGMEEEVKQSYPQLTPKVSAVLIAFYPKSGRIFMPLMERTDSGGVHSRQISFPGGRQEEQDQDLSMTALREAEEEIGIKTETVLLIGELSQLYISPSNFRVHPHIGILNEQPIFVPEPTEVQSIIEVDVYELLDHQIRKRGKVITASGRTILTPYFDIEGHIVWGATAMIISELVEVIRRTKL